MARRKSLLAQMYVAHQKAKLAQQRAEERARRQWETEQRKVAAQLAKDQAKRRREEQQAAQAWQRQQQRIERERQQAQAKAEKEATRQERARQRREAEARRQDARRIAEEARRAVQQHLTEAEIRTEAVQQRDAAIDQLLLQRNRNLAPSSHQAEEVFNTRGPDEFVKLIQRALAASTYPEGLQGSCAAEFRPEARELFVDYELPGKDAVPAVIGYRYVKAKDLIQAQFRKEVEIKKRYEKLVAQVALRTLAEGFAVTPPALVGGIVFNGYVTTKDRATGRPMRPILISVNATREAFTEIVLDEPQLDPKACLTNHLNALVSPHPYDLEPVRPVVQFDLSKYKFIEELDVIAGLDSRLDLLTLKPVEFEHLVRRLFEAIGMKSWITQASRDDGVDAVAVNEDPIVGGLCIIQAKRYSKLVGLEAVHALAGVMEDKCAAKGVLVTTSWVGKASRDFAARNGRIEIIEGRHLKSMLREHLGLDVLISLQTLPPGWERPDIA